MNLSKQQQNQLQEKGISEEEIEHQLTCFTTGTNYVKLLRPASIGDGIKELDRDSRDEAIQRFDDARESLKIQKFVPASGAASRMFKEIYKWLDDDSKHKAQIREFFKDIEKFAFYPQWAALAEEGKIPDHHSNHESKVEWLKGLIEAHGLGLAQKPKALIPFHVKGGEVRLALEEHIAEGLEYAASNGELNIHFTVSENHKSGFEQALKELSEKYKEQVKLNISYSYQQPKTDTITVDMNDQPILNADGEFIFRPGGHGALIHNLNELDADLIFIKNIDNVCHPQHLRQTADYKKVLAGKLLELREDFTRLNGQLQKGLFDERSINEVRDKWKLRIPRDYKKLKTFVNRPMRVCGMVKNQGEPGGGPFFSLDKNYGESLQIIEKNQVDPKQMRQNAILDSSTHFNPVDLVIATKTISGEKLDLTEFIDDSLYFISEKSIEGKDVKVLEWPGLWNGAMANWITVFVEVPITTFNPVKELKDLQRPLHQGR